MPRPKGLPRTGGRKKGTPNKRTLEVQELIDRTGCTDPLEAMIQIAEGNLKCNVCRGKLKTKYKRDDGSLGERICESCYGSGYEIVSPELRGRMWAEVAQYHRPKRKAIEHTVESGPNLTEVLRARFTKLNEHSDSTAR